MLLTKANIRNHGGVQTEDRNTFKILFSTFLVYKAKKKEELDGNNLTTSTYFINLMIISTGSFIVVMLIMLILCTIRRISPSANVTRDLELIF